MLHQPDFTQTKPRTYEQIGHRVQKMINDPKVQKRQFIVVARLPNESPSDWHRFLSEIAETVGIRVDEVEGDGVRIGWQEYCES
jgi:hypothetical protein